MDLQNMYYILLSLENEIKNHENKTVRLQRFRIEEMIKDILKEQITSQTLKQTTI